MGQWDCHFDQKQLLAIRDKHLQAVEIPPSWSRAPSWRLFVCRPQTFSHLTENLAG